MPGVLKVGLPHDRAKAQAAFQNAVEQARAYLAEDPARWRNRGRIVAAANAVEELEEGAADRSVYSVE